MRLALSFTLASRQNQRFWISSSYTLFGSIAVGNRLRSIGYPSERFGQRHLWQQAAVTPLVPLTTKTNTMAPEIVDLISSDDEDIPVPSSSKKNSTWSPQHTLQTSQPGTINPALLSHTIPKPAAFLQSETRSSTASSHTAQDSPITANANSSTNLSPARDNGKGKQRAAPIEEIDLSQDTDDDNLQLPAAPEATCDYGNGEFTEDEALRQAIALSLQEQSPTRPEGGAEANGNLGSGGSGSSRTPTRGAFRAGDGTISPSPVKDGSTDMKPLPNWHSSPVRPTPTPMAKPEPATDQVSTTVSLRSEPAAAAPALPITTTSVSSTCVPTSNNDSTAASGFSLASFDRKQMEAERLARLKRKLGPTSDEQQGSAPKVPRTTQAQVTRDKTVSPPPIARRPKAKETEEACAPSRQSSARSNNDTPQPMVNGRTATTRNSNSTAQANAPPPNLVSLDDGDDDTTETPNLYPNGIALKTFIPGHPMTQTISFEQLISPSSKLESALLSSFIWDFDWLFPHFETRRTKFQLVMHAKLNAERDALKSDFAGVPNVRLTFPPMEGNVNCMHSKLMLLFYKDEERQRWKGGQRCRIVVPTANLVDFDWGVGGFMENTLWLIDLPLKSASTSASASTFTHLAAAEETPFQSSLKEFLKAQTVPDAVLHKLDHFDFSKTARYGFVHTIGGMHSGQKWRTTGLCGLGRTLCGLGLAVKAPISVDYVTSSVGSLNDEFMNSMYLAAQGDDGLTEYNRRLSKKTQPGNHWKENLRFYFPSDSTVKGSKGGPHKAGTICFSARWWQNPKFPKSNMHDCFSVREGLLMHNKVRVA